MHASEKEHKYRKIVTLLQFKFLNITWLERSAVIACGNDWQQQCLKHMDMFMKNLKNLVHSIHSELKKSIPSFKKSHVHELVSAYLGYGSYAAYQVDLSFNKITNDTN